MTKIINIETSKYQPSTLLRGMLVGLCLVVMVGLESCRTAVSTQASVALNTYQTSQTLALGSIAARCIGPPNFTSSFAAIADDKGFSTSTGFLLIQGLDMEIGLGNRWDAGLAAQLGSDFVDYCASARPYFKVRLSENTVPYMTAILFGGEFASGSKSDDGNIWRPFGLGREFSSDSLHPSRSAALQSSTWRVFVSMPINIAVPSSWNEDIIIHPGIHYLEQTIIGMEQMYYFQPDAAAANKYRYVVLNTTDRGQVNRYVIPSLSIGLRSRDQPLLPTRPVLHPELTLALVAGKIFWNLGLSFQFGTFGE